MMKSCKAFVVAEIGLASMLALGPLGCSGGGDASKKGLDPNPERTHIAQAAVHVVNYLAIPENHQKNIKDTSDKGMKDWAVTNKIPEDDLRSTRDHEPYQIHKLSHGAVIIITETTGVKEKKYMFIHSQGRAAPGGAEVTQEEIDKALKSTDTGGRRGGGRPG